MNKPTAPPPCAKAGWGGRAAIAACALVITGLVGWAALAEPNRLTCELTRVQIKTGANFEAAAESKLFAITFDEDAKTLAVERDSKTLPLDHVTMTPITMTGYIDDLSLGVDRSSWSVVLQTYRMNSIRSEFGTCSQGAKPPP